MTFGVFLYGCNSDGNNAEEVATVDVKQTPDSEIDYLAIKNIEKKWTSSLQNWSLTIQQLYIKFGDRVKLKINPNFFGGTPKEIGKPDRV